MVARVTDVLNRESALASSLNPVNPWASFVNAAFFSFDMLSQASRLPSSSDLLHLITRMWIALHSLHLVTGNGTSSSLQAEQYCLSPSPSFDFAFGWSSVISPVIFSLALKCDW